MKIKLDENIPGGAADVLHARQRDFDTVVDEALGGQSDPTVPEAAGIEGRIMITLDRGFGDVRAYPPGTHPGIIVLRPDDQRSRRPSAPSSHCSTITTLNLWSGASPSYNATCSGCAAPNRSRASPNTVHGKFGLP